MIVLRVDDIGRRPSDGPEEGSDGDLSYFARWREAFGVDKSDWPIVYAAVPEWIAMAGIDWANRTLKPCERFAVHGKSHKRGESLSRYDFAVGAAKLSRDNCRCDATVPPFNEYSCETISAFASAVPGGHFFGGFASQHHSFGRYPVRTRGVTHIPACAPLYGRALELADKVGQYAGIKCPLVLTLHIAWDHLSHLAKLREALEGMAIGSCEHVGAWLDRTTLSIDAMTGPHYFAAWWILGRVGIGDRVLDVGSRHSKIPSLMSLHGCTVEALDRSEDVLKQTEIAQRLGARVGVRMFDVRELTDESAYDAITAAWSIQHNTDAADQSLVAKKLARALKPGGQLLVVSSFSPGESFLQTNREDPQLVLNHADHRKVVVEASGLRLEELTTWRYVHGSNVYEASCSPDRANAVAYRLRKVS